MAFRVTILARANLDVESIFRWISQRAPLGAARWYTAFQRAINDLETNPLAYEVAPESPRFDREIRHRMFRTRRGRVYRILFVVSDDEVRVLRIRGPGQTPFTRNDVLPITE
jgi:plasmid stabilization system protein ParE